MMKQLKWFWVFLCFMVCLCSAAGALTYDEAYEQAAASGDPDSYAVVQPAAAERMVTGIFDGLSASYTHEGDELIISIDTEKTDWNRVIVKSYSPGSGEVYLYPGFASPTGESTPHRSFGFSIDGMNTEKYMIELLRRDYEMYGTNSGPRCVNGIGLGRYDESSGLFQPVKTERHGLICAWGEDGELQFEYLTITIRYTSTDPLTVKIPKVPASDIQVLFDMPEADRSQIAATVTNGNVHLQADSLSSLSQRGGGIAVAVPEEAGDEAWTCTGISWGNSWEVAMLEPGQYGVTRRSAQVAHVSFGNDNSTHEDSITLEWHDETGAVRGYAQLYLSVVTGDPKPWPYYAAGWQPVPSSRMDLSKNAFPAGVDAVYDGNGLLTLSIDRDELPESANFGRAFYQVFVSPPDPGCTVVGRIQSSANDIFGAEDAAWRMDEQLLRTRDEAGAYQSSREVVGGNIFRTYHQQGSDLTVYMTSEMTGPFAGRVVLLSWWKEGDDPSADDPFLTEYIVIRQESCVRTLTSSPYASENDLPQVITQPVIVIPQGSLEHPNSSMQFTALIYPQKGVKSRYYKLELVDENGEPVDLENGQYKVFLPFPEGISEEEKQNLELIHMTDAHVEIENFSINGGSLHLTDAGIWFQAKSFSPFMLTWGGEDGGGEDGGEDGPASVCPDGHPLQYDSSFMGMGFAEFCSEECHEAYVEFVGPEKEAYPYGDFIELIISWEGRWRGVEPEVWYAPVIDGEYGDWINDAPWQPGFYAVKMVLGSLETGEYTFTINEPITECSEGHPLQYFLAMEGDGLAEVCTGENCHAAFVEFIGPEKSEFVTGEPIELIISWEGRWLGLPPVVWYTEASSGMWDTEPPVEPGEYLVHLEWDTLVTSNHSFSIIDGEYVPEVECGNGNPLRYELMFRPSGESNGIRQYCPDGCHDVNITFYAPFDITEGGELDYVCSWDGEWLGEEYPELEFARNTDGGYADWSTALPTAAGSYAMRMSFNGLITDYQTFTIFPAQQDDPAQLILPSDLVRIEEEAFAGSQVVSVVCPDGLLSIGSRAFAGCETLRLIVIPGSVTEIAGDAFEGASGFTISGEAGSRAEEVAGEIGVPFEAFAE